MTLREKGLTLNLLRCARYGRERKGLTLYLLSKTRVVSNPFYSPIKSLLLETKCVLKHQDLQKFCFKLNKSE